MCSIHTHTQRVLSTLYWTVFTKLFLLNKKLNISNTLEHEQVTHKLDTNQQNHSNRRDGNTFVISTRLNAGNLDLRFVREQCKEAFRTSTNNANRHLGLLN